MLARDELAIYVQFLYLAIVPQCDTDRFYAQHHEAINRAANFFREKYDYRPRPVYRGILVDPAAVEGGVLEPATKITYLSFSEDRNIACEFADLDSSISQFMKMCSPHFRGYLIEHFPSRDEVLFHYTWAEPLRLHSLGAEHWDRDLVLRQQEVILRQVHRRFRLNPCENYVCEARG